MKENKFKDFWVDHLDDPAVEQISIFEKTWKDLQNLSKDVKEFADGDIVLEKEEKDWSVIDFIRDRVYKFDSEGEAVNFISRLMKIQKARTIGSHWKAEIKKLVIQGKKQGIENNSEMADYVKDKLPQEAFDTWEGAYSEIERLAEDFNMDLPDTRPGWAKSQVQKDNSESIKQQIAALKDELRHLDGIPDEDDRQQEEDDINYQIDGLNRKLEQMKTKKSQIKKDVWNLESNDEQFWGDQLSRIVDKAMSGDKGAQRQLEQLWSEKWERIKVKASAEGSTWYVWWMDGVRNFMRAQK